MNRANPGWWDSALEALKPRKGDLERGLALHGESVVIDAYALGLRPRPSPENMSPFLADLERRIADGLDSRELSNLIEESVQIFNAFDPKAREGYRRLWEASGVTCVLQNAGRESQAPLTLLRRLALHTLVTDLGKDSVGKATAPDDILRAKKENRHCLCLTTNGVPLVQKWESPESELDYIRLFFMLGIRMMHLTYNRRNMIGDGCGEARDAGLSDFGHAVIREMNRVGVIPDVAHSGQATSRDAAHASGRPAVASHSTCAALHDHFRAKTDETIKALAESGGYIGICCIGRFLGRDCGITAFLDHIDHAVRLVGADHVAIGTDLSCSLEGAGYDPRLEAIAVNRPRKKDWESLWPEPAAAADPSKVEAAAPTLKWTNWPLFTVGLVQRGYSDDDIRKIIGGNVLRVMRENLAGTVYAPVNENPG